MQKCCRNIQFKGFFSILRTKYFFFWSNFLDSEIFFSIPKYFSGIFFFFLFFFVFWLWNIFLYSKIFFSILKVFSWLGKFFLGGCYWPPYFWIHEFHLLNMHKSVIEKIKVNCWICKSQSLNFATNEQP